MCFFTGKTKFYIDSSPWLSYTIVLSTTGCEKCARFVIVILYRGKHLHTGWFLSQNGLLYNCFTFGTFF
jgi:hypothetical protein